MYFGNDLHFLGAGDAHEYLEMEIKENNLHFERKKVGTLVSAVI